MDFTININDCYVVVTNYGRGDTIDDTVYLNSEHADDACEKYNRDKTYQNIAIAISVADYVEAQYNRGNDAAYYD